jgi:hypothetical protein
MGNYRICWIQILSDLLRIAFCGGGKNDDFIMTTHSGQEFVSMRSDEEFPDFAIVLSDFEVVLVELRGIHRIGGENEGVIEIDKEGFFAVIGVFSVERDFMDVGIVGFGIFDCQLISF